MRVNRFTPGCCCPIPCQACHSGGSDQLGHGCCDKVGTTVTVDLGTFGWTDINGGDYCGQCANYGGEYVLATDSHACAWNYFENPSGCVFRWTHVGTCGDGSMSSLDVSARIYRGGTGFDIADSNCHLLVTFGVGGTGGVTEACGTCNAEFTIWKCDLPDCGDCRGEYTLTQIGTIFTGITDDGHGGIMSVFGVPTNALLSCPQCLHSDPIFPDTITATIS